MRKSDNSKRMYRRAARDRIFRENEHWFVRTREGIRGPFDSREYAEQEALSFVDTMKYLEENKPSVPPDVDTGNIEIIDMDNPSWR